MKGAPGRAEPSFGRIFFEGKEREAASLPPG